jgi:hypothetical protein
MKKLISILLLSAAVGSFGQQVGLSLGTSMINVGDAGLNPKNICGHLQYSISDDMKMNLSTGFGYDRWYYRSGPTNADLYYPNKSSITGIPIELDLQCSKPLVILSGIRAFIGLGMGYYNYSFKQETSDRVNTQEQASKIKGFAQFFSFGLDYRMGKTISTFIQFRKMGFNTIENRESYDHYINEFSYRPSPGLADLSMTIGILFNLRPRHEMSINIE